MLSEDENKKTMLKCRNIDMKTCNFCLSNTISGRMLSMKMKTSL